MSLEVTTLPSGLRVVTDQMAHLETASLGVWVGAGSRHEAAEEQGLSHLLEHMAFKGTRRRSARAIAEEIEAAGGDLNAATGVEQTAYYAHVLADDTGLALDILSDILTDSLFDRDELEREKGVILQEIGSVEDTPDDLVFDLFNTSAFPDQPIGRPILGTPASVGAFDRDAIGAYLGRHYRGGGMVVGAAGAVEHARIVDETAERFAGIGTNQARPIAASARYVGGETKLKRKLEQAHIVVGWEGLAYEDPDHYALQIFANAVGGGMSSRLFQEVREDRGLAYSIYAFHWAYSDTGLFGFYAATGAGDVAELMPVAIDALAEATRDLSEAEIRRAKAQMKVSLLAALESPSARSEQVARQLLAFDRILSREEMIGRVETLDLAEIRASGARALASKPTVAAIGPVAKVMSAEAVAVRNPGTWLMALFRIGSNSDNATYIRGDGVYLRPPDMHDFEQWAALRHLSRGFLTPWEPTWPTDDLTRPSFRRRLRRHTTEIENDDAYPFLLFRESDDALLGGLTFGQIKRGVSQAATMGYWMGQPFAGQGWMARAVRSACGFAFATLRLHRIEAACLPQNEASIRLLTRTNFQQEGVARAYLRINGIWQDHLLFGLLESDPVPLKLPKRDRA